MATDPDVIEVRRRGPNPILIVLMIVLAFIALFLLVIRPLFFGGDPEEFEEPPAVQPAPSPTAPPAEESPPEETFEVFESKDPFRPLVVAAATGGTGTTAGTTGTTAGTTTTSDTSGTTTTTEGTAPSGPGAAGGSAPSGGQRVQLIDVFEEDGQQKAQVKVGSTVYTVTIDETFAGSYKLVSISGNCATFLHGDDKFTLCEGEEVIK
ncbi:MAG: hypothetical protein KY429_06685 [Actinobacteria bacterium]|nr:hypothetical protein [Actinomycetota bacterium]